MTITNTNDQFYAGLPINESPLSDLLVADHLFSQVPEDWFIVVTDVKNSTLAVQNGLHQTVNLIATGCIVAVLNIAYKNHLNIPFFFGGDGATCIIPSSILNAVVQSLLIHKENTFSNFELDLRVGYVPVNEVYKQGYELKLSKFKSSATFTIPIVLGDGLMFAEKLIKGEDHRISIIKSEEENLDLEGMQCRWDRIAPPENYDEVISLLVVAMNEKEQGIAYSKVVKLLDQIYGTPQKRQPISVARLKLKGTMSRMDLEMKVKFGHNRFIYGLYNTLMTWFGWYYFRTKEGKTYLSSIVDFSDTLVIDGRINTVISGTGAQRITLEKELNELENAGEIKYGLFVSKESVMSCYVPDADKAHIHFVDGAEGGYTKAAGVLKLKNRYS
ncbi:DUF3095 domain-containing protein [Dyadobacter sp. CY345]|uniref:DUF3095 family protein n=1 Tax=Dyadobacter sp. CY345 TaxID=2909335 RepID=UPI001F2C4AFF|nr:DUF3095 family protein [Dyadobacter sp. CY345]MCF2443777.1 DUF3095 domain-containing protein [Dyadobacter sp. CY345]